VSSHSRLQVAASGLPPLSLFARAFAFRGQERQRARVRIRQAMTSKENALADTLSRSLWTPALCAGGIGNYCISAPDRPLSGWLVLMAFGCGKAVVIGARLVRRQHAYLVCARGPQTSRFRVSRAISFDRRKQPESSSLCRLTDQTPLCAS